MEFESHLNELRSIRGYLASNILNWTGEFLAQHTTDPSIDTTFLSALCNDVFNHAHSVVEKIDANQECTETLINMPFGTVILRCSGKSAKAHIHVGCIIVKDGNVALARMTVEKIAKTVSNLL